MSVQTSYDFSPRTALEGNLANYSIADLTVKAAETIIAFGRAAVRGTNDDQCKLPSGASDKFLGVAVRIFGVENPLDSEKSQYEIKEEVSILRKGYIWVITEQAVSPGDPVYFRHTVNSGETIGQFRKDADTDKATQITGATFESTTDAGNKLALIRIG